jgi:hypothetical protein
MGRPPIRKKGPFTAAERQARRRIKLRREAKEAKRALRPAKEAPQSHRTKVRKVPLAVFRRHAQDLLEEAVRDPQSSDTYERWWATALQASADMDPSTAAKMFNQLAIALKVVINMSGWPHGIVE